MSKMHNVTVLLHTQARGVRDFIDYIKVSVCEGEHSKQDVTHPLHHAENEGCLHGGLGCGV